MSPFPAPSELQFLIGNQLSQIALDPHSVQFRWRDGGQITSQYDFDHIDEAGQAHHYDCTAYTGPPLLLHRLIQKKVVTLESEAFCLALVFEGGQILRFRSEVSPYECGVIQFTDNLAAGYIVY